MTRFRFVLLDLDGTLVDTRDDLVASTNHVRRELGLAPLAPEAILRLVGHGARALVEQALGPEAVDRHGEGVRILLEHYQAHCLDRSAPYPGLVEQIDSLAEEGVTFAVLTNKLEAVSRTILEGLGLASRLTGIVGGDTFPEKKPDPRGAVYLRERAGAAPEATLMVGDSAVDVATSRRAGIACCGVLWGFDPDGVRAAAPDFVVSDAAALAAVIRGR